MQSDKLSLDFGEEEQKQQMLDIKFVQRLLLATEDAVDFFLFHSIQIYSIKI
jgi:hypothetical protein